MSTPYRGILCTREGLIWHRAHEIKRMMDLSTPTGVRLWRRYYEMITQTRARA